LSTGYDIGRFRISAGIGIVSTSKKENTQLLFQSDFKPDTTQVSTKASNYSFYVIHRNIGIPISIGYIIPVTDKFRIIPELGLIPARTLPILHTLVNEKTKEQRRAEQNPGLVYHTYTL
jgi:hypothetical protein